MRRAAALALLAPVLVSAAPAPSPRQDPPAALRRLVVEHINAARAEAGLPPYRVDLLLERVGDRHCRDLIADDTSGHFSTSGVPPYLRYLLAGGNGFHRENASAYDTTGTIAAEQLAGILVASVDRMLAEAPPSDGHRRTLLDPDATHIGVGLAITARQVRMTHEVATELAEVRARPAPSSRPGQVVRFSGLLPSPWEAVQLELLWEPLPRPLTAQQAAAIGAYRYPGRRALYLNGGLVTGDGTPVAAPPSASGSLQTGPGGRFLYRWRTSASPGVEIAVLLARRAQGDRVLVPVATAATVVTDDGTLPAAMAPWSNLGLPFHHPTDGRE
jgi:uncharacterized protein YkwD